jgi:hypothetical protein
MTVLDTFLQIFGYLEYLLKICRILSLVRKYGLNTRAEITGGFNGD